MSIRVIYAHESFPEHKTKSIFLAGPTPRDSRASSWRPAAIKLLIKAGYDGDVYVPESRTDVWKDDYDGQVKWEEEGLNQADCILFWIPRDMKSMPALTTNNEFGFWTARDPHKLVAGAPNDAFHISYQRYYANNLNIFWGTTLKDVVDAAIMKVGSGASRKGGECQVPVHIWNTQAFKSWLTSHHQANNRLDGARVEWTFRTKTGFIFSWGLKVNIYVSAENRNKANEFIVARTDATATVAYHHVSSDLNDSFVVLVREFRSPVRNSDEFVWELPGGSSPRLGLDPLLVAADELNEEIGLKIDPARLKTLGSRQVLGTLLTHQAELFSVELDDDEIARLRSNEANNVTHGVTADTELTYTRVRTVREILSDRLVDWSTMGMIYQALAGGNE